MGKLEAARFAGKDGSEVLHEVRTVSTVDALLFQLATTLGWLDVEATALEVLGLVVGGDAAVESTNGLVNVAASHADEVTHRDEGSESDDRGVSDPTACVCAPRRRSGVIEAVA